MGLKITTLSQYHCEPLTIVKLKIIEVVIHDYEPFS